MSYNNNGSNNNQQRVDTLFNVRGFQMPANAGYPVPPGVDYAAQARYGLPPTAMNPLAGLPPLMIPYGIPGHVPGVPDPLRPYNQLGMLPMGAGDPLAYDKSGEAAALAEGMDQLQLNPMNKDYGQGRGRGDYNGRGGHRPQHGRGRHMQESQGGRGGRSPMHGRGGGGRGQKQPPKKKKHQKGLEDNVRRTVYISYIDQQVTEEQLATFFSDCGKVIDCRICGDPNSAMRFAFIEFTEIESATEALNKTGSILGSSPLRVLPSKTAIVPVNKELMPRSHDELERCSRTIYAANIDKKVDRNDVRGFFESLCGKVSKIRLLGDFAHSTRIAFVEFHQAEGAMAALNCSGALLGSLPVRVSPSKTPVRSEPKDGESSSS